MRKTKVEDIRQGKRAKEECDKMVTEQERKTIIPVMQEINQSDNEEQCIDCSNHLDKRKFVDINLLSEEYMIVSKAGA